MRIHRRPRPVALAIALLLALPCVLVTAAPPAQAQLPGPPGLDHFQCYPAANVAIAGVKSWAQNPIYLNLADQFTLGAVGGVGYPVALAKNPNQLCNPVEKRRLDIPEIAPITNPNAHLVCWSVMWPATVPPPTFNVRVQNQFGDAELTVKKATKLCVPSWKFLTPTSPPLNTPPGLDHFECYSVGYRKTATGAYVDKFEIPPGGLVDTLDQFGASQQKVGMPNELCNPVQKTLPTGQVFPITNPEAHLVCFVSKGTPVITPPNVFPANQFGQGQVSLKPNNKLCLPSYKQIVP